MKIMSTLFILLLLSSTSFGTYKLFEKHDWWTGTFCASDNGILNKRLGMDHCIIDGEKYVARYVRVGVSNLTSGLIIKHWKLVSISDGDRN